MMRTTPKTNKIINFVQLWLPPIAWALVIFLFSSYPTVRTSEIHWKDFIVKKTAHVVEYAILTLLVYRALKESGMDKKRAALYAVFVTILYGFSDELHQSITPGREPRLRDVFFDTIGGILAIFALWRLLPKAPKQLKYWAEKLQIQ